MIVVFIAAFFCVLNIALWFVFILKFKKLFSTDDIIASAREQMDRMIADINRNASRNIELIEDRVKQLKIVLAEADRHLGAARRELENQQAAMDYQQKIDSVKRVKKEEISAAHSRTSSVSRAAQQYLHNQNLSDSLQSGKRFEVTEEGSRHVQQGDLFDLPEDESRGQIISDSGTTFTVERDGSSHASVPILGGNVTYADEPIQPKMTFAQSVKNLTLAGHSVEEIASELNSSTTEVQLVLDFPG